MVCRPVRLARETCGRGVRGLRERVEARFPVVEVGVDGFFVFAAALVFLCDGLPGCGGEGEIVDLLVDAANVILHEGSAVKVG